MSIVLSQIIIPLIFFREWFGQFDVVFFSIIMFVSSGIGISVFTFERQRYIIAHQHEIKYASTKLPYVFVGVFLVLINFAKYELKGYFILANGFYVGVIALAIYLCQRKMGKWFVWKDLV